MTSFWAHRAVAIAGVLGVIGILGAKTARADGITPEKLDLLGVTSVTIGLTPIQDSPPFGRFFLDCTLNGNFNAFVFWVASLSEQPFTVDDGQFTFTPGVYTYPTSNPDEQVVISANQAGGQDDISFWVGAILFDFDLPSTVMPNPNSGFTTGNGDEYYLVGVPATAYYAFPALPLPEPSSFGVLGVGFGLIAALLCLTRFRTGRKEHRNS